MSWIKGPHVIHAKNRITTARLFLSQLDPMVLWYTGADPGFPVGGAWTHFGGGGGRGPLTWVLFSENVCENERIGSHGGGGRAPENFECRSANGIY